MMEYHVTVYVADGSNAKEMNRTVAGDSSEEVAGYIHNLFEREKGYTIVDDVLVYPSGKEEPEIFPV